MVVVFKAHRSLLLYSYGPVGEKVVQMHHKQPKMYLPQNFNTLLTEPAISMPMKVL